MAKREYDRSGSVLWLDDDNARHREGGPAEVWYDGTQWWFSHNLFHFAHGPADLYDDGRLRWLEDNLCLRMRDPYG